MSDTTTTIHNDKIQVIEGANGRSVFARQAIGAGQVVLPLGGDLVPAPNRYTLQVDAQRHLAPEGRDWAFVNHSCTPCVRIDFARNAMVALRDIRAGEEITFNYLTTEYRMVEPFRCVCGTADCLGTIAGFGLLDRERQQALRLQLSDYLAGLVCETT